MLVKRVPTQKRHMTNASPISRLRRAHWRLTGTCRPARLARELACAPCTWCLADRPGVLRTRDEEILHTSGAGSGTRRQMQTGLARAYRLEAANGRLRQKGHSDELSEARRSIPTADSGRTSDGRCLSATATSARGVHRDEFAVELAVNSDPRQTSTQRGFRRRWPCRLRGHAASAGGHLARPALR